MTVETAFSFIMTKVKTSTLPFIRERSNPTVYIHKWWRGNMFSLCSCFHAKDIWFTRVKMEVGTRMLSCPHTCTESSLPFSLFFSVLHRFFFFHNLLPPLFWKEYHINELNFIQFRIWVFPIESWLGIFFSIKKWNSA